MSNSRKRKLARQAKQTSTFIVKDPDGLTLWEGATAFDMEQLQTLKKSEEMVHILVLHGTQQREMSVPRGAEYLLFLFLPKATRANLIGDLQEEYLTCLLPRFGKKAADWWYCIQVFTSLVPLAWAFVRRVAGIALLSKLVGR